MDTRTRGWGVAVGLFLAGATAPAAMGGDNRELVAVIEGSEVPAPAIAHEMGDPETVARILDEGKNRNQIMEHLKYLTQEIGARLTGSSNARRANDWCKQQYDTWGLADAHLEQWGEIGVGFDRGASSGKVFLRKEIQNEDASITVEHEAIRDLVLTTLAWSAGTNQRPDGTSGGAVRGLVLKEPKTDAEYATVKDKLAGAWILLQAPSAMGQRGIRGMMGARYDMRKAARKKVAEGKQVSELTIPERLTFDGVAGYISASRDERVWTGAIPGWRELKLEDVPTDVHILIRGSDYDFLNSRVYDGEPVEVEVDLNHTFNAGPAPTFNTIAEIRGSELPEECVIVSAHLDSWNGPGSQGCTDNGTGTVVTLEAARILLAAGAKPKRTIRFIHWTGEEQGLLGSEGYVKAHPEELPRISAVFVDDGGTNSEGGLTCIESMRDMLAAATAPVNNQFYDDVTGKPLNVNIQVKPKMPVGGGSDHASFNKVGVPGFFWEEVGRADYGFGWHTQNDRLDLAIPRYLEQSSTCAAVTAYRLACAPTLLAREVKETPEPKATEPAPNGGPNGPGSPNGTKSAG